MLNFTEWDSYIISSGAEKGLGFSFFQSQSIPTQTTKHELRVSTFDKEWRLELGDLKEKLWQWTFVTFTWESSRGLKLYFQGNLTANVSNPQSVSRNPSDQYKNLFINRPSSDVKGWYNDEPQIYDLSIWKREISAYLAKYRFKTSECTKFLFCVWFENGEHIKSVQPIIFFLAYRNYI